MRPALVHLRVKTVFMAWISWLKSKVEGVASLHVDSDCCRGFNGCSERETGKGAEKVFDSRSRGEGKGKGVLGGHRSSLRFVYSALHASIAYLSVARSISKKLSIKVSAPSPADDHSDLWRGIRNQVAALLDGLDPKDLATMSLGLSHSLSR